MCLRHLFHQSSIKDEEQHHTTELMLPEDFKWNKVHSKTCWSHHRRHHDEMNVLEPSWMSSWWRTCSRVIINVIQTCWSHHGHEVLKAQMLAVIWVFIQETNAEKTCLWRRGRSGTFFSLNKVPKISASGRPTPILNPFLGFLKSSVCAEKA